MSDQPRTRQSETFAAKQTTRPLDSGIQINPKIRNGEYMQASGAVSRVRQARTRFASSAERGCPHESRRGHAFITTCGGFCSEHDSTRRLPITAAVLVVYTAEDCHHEDGFLLDGIFSLQSHESTMASLITAYWRQRATRARFRCLH